MHLEIFIEKNVKKTTTKPLQFAMGFEPTKEAGANEWIFTGLSNWPEKPACALLFIGQYIDQKKKKPRGMKEYCK